VINVGIIGGETEAAGELIRILINHPDVVLRTVCSTDHTGERIDRYHRGLTGDTDLCFSKSLDPAKLNCVFLSGESWQAREFVESVNAPSHRQEQDGDDDDDENTLRIIDMTGCFLNGDSGMVYGFPEFHRKAMVRGALRASLPSAIAIAVELALFPLAKNHLLHGNAFATVSLPRNSALLTHDGTTAGIQTFPSSLADDIASRLSTRLDPVAPAGHRPDTGDATTEIGREMKAIDPTYSGDIKLSLASDSSCTRGLKAKILVPCNANVEEVRHLYNEAYSDHGFTFLLDREPVVADVSNTNKCLLGIEAAGNASPAGDLPGLRITAVIDNLVKGSAGNAVHCMNLLFGLSERTGLALKASVV